MADQSQDQDQTQAVQDRRRDWTWLAVAAVALAIGGLAGYFFGKDSKETAQQFRIQAEQALSACKESAASEKAKYAESLAKLQAEKQLAEGSLKGCDDEVARLSTAIADCCRKPAPVAKAKPKPKPQKPVAKYRPAPTAQPPVANAPCPGCSEFAWNPADPRQPRPGTISQRIY